MMWIFLHIAYNCIVTEDGMEINEEVEIILT